MSFKFLTHQESQSKVLCYESTMSDLFEEDVSDHILFQIKRIDTLRKLSEHSMPRIRQMFNDFDNSVFYFPIMVARYEIVLNKQPEIYYDTSAEKIYLAFENQEEHAYFELANS